MRRYLARRLLFAVLTLWGVDDTGLRPFKAGDPIHCLLTCATTPTGCPQIRWRNLRRSGVWISLSISSIFVWLGNILQGDMGESIATQRSVWLTITEALPNNLQLAGVAWVLGTVPGVLLGIVSAVKRGTAIDYFGRAIALIGQATPAFWLAILCVLLFAGYLQWLPSATKAPATTPLLTQAKHFVMPAFVLAFDPWATYLRLTRSSMLEVLDSE